MSYDITIITPDAGGPDGTYNGELYLPGEPCNYGEGWTGRVTCEFCGDKIAVGSPEALELGQHLGVIVVSWSPIAGVPEMPGEIVHLRCAMDLTTQGSFGFITQGAEYDATGRHAAA